MAIAVQNHIHLSKTLSDVTTPVESSKWVVAFEGWQFEPEVFVSLDRGFGGQLRPYAALTPDGEVLVADNYEYRLRLDGAFGETAQERETRIRQMNGKVVYVHHNQHDEDDHSTGYKTMFLVITGWSAANPSLGLQYVNIRLEDMNIS